MCAKTDRRALGAVHRSLRVRDKRVHVHLEEPQRVRLVANPRLPGRLLNGVCLSSVCVRLQTY